MKPALAPHRLLAQRLVGEPNRSPAEVVGQLGAVQSQLHDIALWAIGRRCHGTLAEVEAAFAAGDFIRTHVLRPTWHFVLPADLRDLLEVTAPRVRQAMATNVRRDGLTVETIEHWATLAIEAITAHGPLTRQEIEAHLIEAGFVQQGNSLAHVLMHAELTGEIHNGPMRGKKHTHMAANLPASQRTPDERLTWLAETYGRGHGPFRDRDLAWWATLTLGQARRAIELADLQPIEVDGTTYHHHGPPTEAPIPPALLLPAFDEFISYARDPEDYDHVGGDVNVVLRTTGLLFVHGALSGSWKRAIAPDQVTVEVMPTVAITPTVASAIEEESQRFGTFLNRPVTPVTHALR